MVNHESRKKRNKNQVQFAWFMSSNVIPPDDVPTDDEFADTPGSSGFRGRRIVRRKIRNGQDQDQVLSKFLTFARKKNLGIQPIYNHNFRLISICGKQIDACLLVR